VGYIVYSSFVPQDNGAAVLPKREEEQAKAQVECAEFSEKG
jgi:hypothetical protein